MGYNPFFILILIMTTITLLFGYNFFSKQKEYTYGIIGAMEVEIKNLVSDLKNKKEEKHNGLTFYLGKLKNYDVIIVKCGVGKVNAGRTAQVLISEYSPKYIINTGIGGGLTQNLSIGDAVISTDLIQYDFDISALGFPKGYMYTGVNPDQPTKFNADQELIERFKTALEELGEKRNIFTGRILTGDTFVSSKEDREELVKTFDGISCEMEGAAIAQVCTLNEIPFVVVRVISDLPNGQGVKDYSEFEKESGESISQAIENVLDD